jgi:hypothetical protein
MISKAAGIATSALGLFTFPAAVRHRRPGNIH